MHLIGASYFLLSHKKLEKEASKSGSARSDKSVTKIVYIFERFFHAIRNMFSPERKD
jgi:hypothetical protein